jgi:gamma-glutamyltranspeptidase / glutathione hydrolase
MTSDWPAQEPRRSPHGMIASLNPLASATGLRILRRGGNAVDAAIAAGAVLTVVEPWTGQLGGDVFMLLARNETGQITAINGSGAAPRAATLDHYRALGAIPESGWLSSTVPGLVDGWRVAGERFGTMPLARLLEDAIGYADDGFPMSARLARQNAERAPVGLSHAATRAVFYPNGEAPPAGYRLRQPNLAATLRRLQRDGADAFYRGPIAKAIVEASQSAGGLFSTADFDAHRTDVLPAIETTYRGWRVIEQPPVSQGVILLMALNMLEGSPLPDDPVDRLHRQVEVHKLALAERLRAVGDPRLTPLDVERLLDKARAASLASQVDNRKARSLGGVPAGHPDTTYLCVVDEARNAVSYIHSLYAGSGVIAGDTGILLNNRMACFSLEDGPNQLAPGKRPVHTLNSWMLMAEGRPRVIGGTPGSFWQVQTNLQLISNLIDGGLEVQEAVDAPRWRMGPQTSWTEASLELEGRFGAATAERLRQLGHQVTLIGDWQAGGAAQLISLDDEGLTGAGDPRPGTSAVLGY